MSPTGDRLYCNYATAIPAVPSVVRNCADCEIALWVSNEMRRVVDSGEVKPTCHRCVMNRLAETPNVVAEVHPDQTENLAHVGLLGFADQFVTRFNRRWGPPYPANLFNYECPCAACKPDDLDPWSFRAQMHLCPTCGNRRCPGAVDHTRTCSGSNEPGQPGSFYENAPRPHREESPDA